jgi:hypothetical protein
MKRSLNLKHKRVAFGVPGTMLIGGGGLNNTGRAGMLLLCGKSSIPYLAELHSEELEEEL